jgi:hydroxymethylpyrimidine pyrophosphatase-like HAD family hydrolase
MCGCSIAVANALPVVKKRVDFITRGAHGDGVLEIIDNLLGSDLASPDARLFRRND